jgi:hypothetical protein
MHPANVCTRTHARASAHARTRTHARKSTRALTGTCAHTHARGVERRDSRCTPKVPDSTISGQRTFANSFRSRSFSRLIDSVCLCVPTRAHLRRTVHEPNANRTKRSEAGKPSLGTFADRPIDARGRRSNGPMGRYIDIGRRETRPTRKQTTGRNKRASGSGTWSADCRSRSWRARTHSAERNRQTLAVAAVRELPASAPGSISTFYKGLR